MTAPERLRAIRERCESATPGPWERRSGGGYDFGGHDEYGLQFVDAPVEGFVAETQYGHEKARRDAEFIAHARDDVEWLLSLADALMKAAADYEEKTRPRRGEGWMDLDRAGPERIALRKLLGIPA